jgi:Na+/H+-dicarboxylate symporter
MIKKILLNPFTVILMIPLGILLGITFPSESQSYKFIGSVYLNLLKLAVLPYLLATILIGITTILSGEESSTLIKRIAIWFLISSIVASTVGVISFYCFSSEISQEQHLAFGNLVNDADSSNDLEISLNHPEPEVPSLTLQKLFERFIPENIFANLTSGDNLKVVIFAIVFGIALSKTNSIGSNELLALAKTVQQSCVLIFNWINYILPFALLSIIASQVGLTGLNIFSTMIEFIIQQSVACLLIVLLSGFVICYKSKKTVSEVFKNTLDSLLLAISTRSTAITIPSAKYGLANLGFKLNSLEFVVPFSFTLNRLGPAVYFSIAALFVMKLYSIDLTISAIFIVIFGSILSSLASTGLTGALTVSTLALVCDLLQVSSEVAIILLIAVDSFTDITRTICTVYGNLAVATLIVKKDH